MSKIERSQQQVDVKYMRLAIKAARMASPGADGTDPLVGAVVVNNGRLINSAYRGQDEPGEHAEFTLLQKKVRTISRLAGATLYTTLEPCTTRTHKKLPCSDWIVQKGIRRVVIGLLDPNPTICGRGYWRLRDANIDVDFVSVDLANEIATINSGFVSAFRGVHGYSDEFSSMIKRVKSARIAPYIGLGWHDNLSILDCPYLRDGWALTAIRITKEPPQFSLPVQLRRNYSEYCRRNKKERRLSDDDPKFMLTMNPTSFSDSPALELTVKQTKYSEVQFYRDTVATVQSQSTPLIEDFIRGSLKAQFPHSLCMHLVVVTSDNKVLITKRSPKVAYHPGSWSASIEEQLSIKDFRSRRRTVVENWASRFLHEELGLDVDSYRKGDFRILSVFLESDILNASLCGYVELRVNSDSLGTIIRGKPREDYEFTEFDFIELERNVLLSELRRPSYQYHPTSTYRLMMTFLKRFGMPKSAELRGLIP